MVMHMLLEMPKLYTTVIKLQVMQTMLSNFEDVAIYIDKCCVPNLHNKWVKNKLDILKWNFYVKIT